MTTSALVLLILLLYMGVMVGFSLLARRRIRSFQDTIAAPKQTTLLLLVGSAVGGHIGSGFVIGGAEYGALYGVGGAWYGIACGCSYFAVALMSGFIFRKKYLSVADYFAQRYTGKANRLIYSVATICGAVSLLAGQLVAGRAVLVLLGIPETVGVVVIAVAAVIYACTAGLWGNIAVSTVQSVIIFFGMVAAIIVMLTTSGISMLTENLPAVCFSPLPFSGEFLAEITLPLIMAAPVYQLGFQTVNSCKTPRTACVGYILAGLLLIPLAFIPPLLGMYGRVLFPQLSASEVFMELLLTRLPVVVAAVILAAVMCAVIASCNSAYIIVAANMVHDIYQGMIAPEADSKTCRKLMLVVDAVTCVIGVLLALRMNDIIRLLSMGYSLVAAGCLVPFLGGIVWKGGTSRGALLSAFVGMGSSLLHSLGVIDLPYACVTSILLAAAAYWLGSRLLPETALNSKE